MRSGPTVACRISLRLICSQLRFCDQTSRRRDVNWVLGIRPFALLNRRTRDGRNSANSRSARRQSRSGEESNDLVFLLIRQAEIAGRHVDIVLDLGGRPAVYFFRCSCRAMSGSDREGKFVAGVVEVNQLLQALDVAVMKKLLLEIGPGCLGSRALWRCHGHIARRHYLLLAIDARRKRCPILVRVGSGTEATAEESS